MHLIDTHAHMGSDRLRDEIPDLIERALEADVRQIINIGTDLEDSAEYAALSEEHEPLFATAGVHPTSIHEVTAPDWVEQIRELTETPGVLGIGEAGLDYYHSPQDSSDEATWRKRQAEFFEAQIQLAHELGLPLVIHERESAEDLWTMMKPWSGKVKAVFHCFTGDMAEAKRRLDAGFHLSFTGVVTFKSAREVAEVAAWMPLDRMMVETDAPYLAPTPNRGKRNEPAWVRHTAAFIADRRGISLGDFAEASTQTAQEFFRIPA